MQVYETPDGQVFLRKARPKFITDEELLCVRKEVRLQAKTRHVIVERDGQYIIIHSAGEERFGDRAERMSPFLASRRILDALAEDNAQYHAVFRFTLVAGPPRIFMVDRWCFLGSIDNWYSLECGPLDAMIRKYAPHIGAQSFFDLM